MASDDDDAALAEEMTAMAATAAAAPVEQGVDSGGFGPRRRSLHPAAPLLPLATDGNVLASAAALSSPAAKQRRSSGACRRSSMGGGDPGTAAAPAAICASPTAVGMLPPPLAKASSFALSPNEGTPPDACVRPAQPHLLHSCGMPKLARTPSGRVSWAPGTPTPSPSRERLHKRARGISDAALEEAGY